MYRLALNRDMSKDQTGLRFWSDALTGANALTRAQLVGSWLDSLDQAGSADTVTFDQRVSTMLTSLASATTTFSSATTTAPAAVSIADYGAAYAVLLGDAAGRAAANADPEAAIVNRAARLYMALFDRAPDASGLVFWANAMAAQPATTDATFAQSMLGSLEAQALYPSTMTIATFGTVLSGRVLGRAPTSNELASFTGQTRGAVAMLILGTAATAGTNLLQQESTLLFNDKVAAAVMALQPAVATYIGQSAGAVSLAGLAQAAKAADTHVEPVVLSADATVNSARLGTTLTKYTVDRWGNVLTMTDPRDANWVTTYTYNNNNQVLSTTTPFSVSGSTVVYSQTSTAYDKLGRVASTTDGRYYTTRLYYDSNGNVVTESHADGGVVKSVYSLFGQRLSVQQPGNGATPGVKTNYAYDHFGNLKSTSTDAAVAVYEIQNTDSNKPKYELGWPSIDAVKIATRQLVETYSYDELGRRITTRNAAGETSQTRYDVSGNVIAQQDAMGNTTRTWYDALGHKLAQLDALGTHKQTWDVDANGRITGSTNFDYYSGSGWLSSLKTTYAYDGAGRLLRQTSSFNIGSKNALKQDTEQSLNYVYDGQELRTINDQGTGQVTTYAYDRAGNRIRERITFAPTNANVPARTQNNTSTYDLQNRLTSVQDDVYTISYTYDGNGNRTNTHTEFDQNGTRVKFDAYNTYDAMNRQLTVNGASTDGGKTVTMGTNGHVLTYDQAGNRLTDSYHGAKFALVNGSWTATTGASVVTVETYTYDGAGRLSGVSRDGLALGTRYYDAEGRVLESGVVPEAITTIGNTGALKSALAAAGLKGEYQVYLYDADGHVIHQVTRTIDKGWTADVYFVSDQWNPTAGYDADGNLTGYTAIDMVHGAKIKYSINYRFLNGGAQELSTTVLTETGGVNSTSSEYDANGNRNVIREANGSIRTRLWYDAAGQVMDKLEAGTTTFSLIVNDQVLGTEDKSATNVLGTTYSTLSASAPQDAPSVYVVQNTNETLQTVAKTLWGDQNLWYLIADANGLSLTSTLQVDQTLRIPARVSTVHNSADTFKPYNASEAIGDTAPLPVPGNAHGGCGTIGTVIAVVIAVYVTAVTAGAAAGWLAEAAPTVFGATAAGTAAASAAVVPNALALAVGGAIGGAAGSVASQAFNIATHAQEHMNWHAVAKSAVSGAVSGGLNGIDGFNELDAWQKGAITSAMTQGVSIVTGLQNGFSWRTVAGAGLGAAVGAKIADPSLTGLAGFANAFAANFAAGVTTAAIQNGKVTVREVAADAFGNVLGNSLAPSPKQDDPLGDFIQAHQKEWDAIPVDEASIGVNLSQLPRAEPAMTAEEVKRRVMLDILGEQARDDSLITPELLQTGGPGSLTRYRPGSFEMVRNNNWDEALNVAADPLGLLGELPDIKNAIGQLSQAQAKAQVDGMRDAMIKMGVKNVPTGYIDYIGESGSGIDYRATANQLGTVYENHIRDQRLRETWGDDYESIRIGKSQMTVLEFEKKVLDLHVQATDIAYDQGVDLIRTKKLTVTDGQYARTLGSFIDEQVRDQLRGFAKTEGINDGPMSNIWAINRRIKSNLVDGYGIPDGRIGLNIFHDTTLARKDGYTPQLSKWNAIRPGNFLIIRPTELGGPYVLPRQSIQPYVPQPKLSGRKL